MLGRRMFKRRRPIEQLPPYPSVYSKHWYEIKAGWHHYNRGPWKWLNYETLAEAVNIEPYELYTLLWYAQRVTRDDLQPIADALGWRFEVLVEELRKERARRWVMKVRRMSRYELLNNADAPNDPLEYIRRFS